MPATPASTAEDRKRLTNNDVRELVTNEILACLAAGIVPWRRPWASWLHGGLRNATSNHHYQGINTWLLGAAMLRRDWQDPRFLTYKQARALGGHVKRGERAARIVFAKSRAVRDRDTPDHQDDHQEEENGRGFRRIVLLAWHAVFNVEQCEALDLAPLAPADAVAPVDRIPRCEGIVAAYQRAGGPSIVSRGSEAFYVPVRDGVVVPEIRQFESPERYYHTLFHELAHSTGHRSRLARTFGAFGTDDYAREELLAEMSANLLACECGIDVTDHYEQSAAYIDNWRAQLSRDKSLVMSAASAGQAAVDWIKGDRSRSPEARRAEEAAA